MRSNEEARIRRTMAALAAQTVPDGRRAMKPDGRTERYIKKAGRQIAQLASRCENGDIVRLAGTARMMEVCAREAALAGKRTLPSCGGVVRIELIMKKLCACGDEAVTEQALVCALDAFDEVQGLAMDEYWAAPDALRMVLCRAWSDVALNVIRAAQERIRAEEWVYSGGSGDVPARSSAFCERALQLAMELEKPDLRGRIEEALARIDSSAESVVRHAHEARALAIMRLDNISAGRNMLDNINWRAVFEKTSRTEGILRDDPSETYPAMDAASREAVRRETTHIAARLDMGESAVARCALNASAEFPRGDVKNCICWWLYDDEGRRELVRRLGSSVKIRTMVPDPHGRIYMGLVCALTLIISALCTGLCRSAWVFLPALVISWRIALEIMARALPRIVHPVRPLRMEYASLPDSCRTLVVIPALIPDGNRAVNLCRQLEKLGCLENDPNIDFLLLGDFRDADEHIKPEDDEIVTAAKKCICEMNARAGRAKYHYLHRGRRYAAADGIYRGHARKRGALMALGRLVTGRGSDEFTAEGEWAQHISGCFRYVVTLDADTQMLPGDARKMVGVIAHPLNARRAGRGYAVMQPCVENDPSAPATMFSRLFSGVGGLSTYSGLISELIYDMTGRGSYCGKGVIDMPAFVDALEGRLDEDRILSHDLIEGILSRAGRISDIALFDGFPADYGRYCARLSRWTRGDWQLLPDMLRRDIDLLDRFRLGSNLITSLWEPALFAMLLVSAWTLNRAGFSLAAIFALGGGVFLRAMGDKNAFRRSCLQLALLPAGAYVRLDAAVCAVYRTFVSGKKLLDWVTSADASGDRRVVRATCGAGAILLIPALFAPGWTLPAAALGVLFLLGPGWVNELGCEKIETERLADENDRRLLHELAGDIWRYFAENVGEHTCFLPPDNVQEEPDNGPAMRTSPTNIAMYLMSCVCAREMGFIPDDEMISRMSAAADTLERLEKWNGHLYNWYDIAGGAPLAPRYVSSVDSGNLVAALLLCANAVKGTPVAGRFIDLAKNTDLSALYDTERRLFFIGADAEHGRMSRSHYDLLASESRILSYAAMMLGQTGPESWRALGRPASMGTLVSWSGTMFEYLMPYIFMPSAPGTLLDGAMKGCVKAQIDFGRRMMRPWGVSESGYHAFDMDLNYQYRAFGLKELSLEGRIQGHVTAPYAACLALMVRPAEAVKNIRRMLYLGWRGEYGLYEAADYTHPEPGIVKSWMAHHQGMALCAICNCLKDGILRKIFMDIPEATALEMLLNERPAPRIRLRPGFTDEYRPVSHQPRRFRAGRPDTRLADVCILGGAGATAVVTARGDIGYRRSGVWANRFTKDMLRRRDAMVTRVENLDIGAGARINSAASHSIFEAGRAEFSTAAEGLECSMSVCISPSDGALVKRLRIENTTGRPVRARITDAFETAIMTEGEMRSHPAFFRLFLRADLSQANAVIFRRRGREEGEEHMALFHMMDGADCRRSTSWTRFCGDGSCAEDMPSAQEGPVLDPGSMLRADIEIEPGGIRAINIIAGLCAGDGVYECTERYTEDGYAARQEKLARSHGRSMAEFAGLDDEKSALIQRAAAFILDPRLAGHRGMGEDARPAGVPWDIPLVCVFMDGNDSLPVLRDAVRMHEYCREMGLEWQLVAVDDSADDYFRPLRDSVEEMIGASHLRDMRYARGGVTLINGSDMTGPARRSLVRSACIQADGRSSLWQQLRRRLMALEYAPAAGYSTMPADDWDAGETGFAEDGYTFEISPGNIPDVPWSNIITGEKLGMLMTGLGGGFIWHENSRLRRVTNFDNDPMHDGWGTMFYVADLRRGVYARALPGDVPMGKWRVSHMLWGSVFETSMDGLGITTRVFHDDLTQTLRFMITVENKGAQGREISVSAFMDWLMGEDSSDSVRTRMWNKKGAVFASGGISGAAFMACDAADAVCGPERNVFLGHGGVMHPDGLMDKGCDGGCVLRVRRRLESGGACTVSFAVGVSDSISEAEKSARRITETSHVSCALERTKDAWKDMRDCFSLFTGDETLDAVINGFIPKQVLDGRIRARAGFYQAGGAYGFRDQLQDMLAMLPYDSALVRRHILRCAAHQFTTGDVMHWWHEPASGVRTSITDDMLFLPFVTSEYVRYTGDTGILDESAEYLVPENIPEGKSDWYGQAQPSGEWGTLRDHCMRAFRRAWRCGAHGLLLMGGGDWNDGMNRVGDKGRGESVWLTMFFAFAAESFADVLDKSSSGYTADGHIAGENACADSSGEYAADGHGGKPEAQKHSTECSIGEHSSEYTAEGHGNGEKVNGKPGGEYATEEHDNGEYAYEEHSGEYAVEESGTGEHVREEHTLKGHACEEHIPEGHVRGEHDEGVCAGDECSDREWLIRCARDARSAIEEHGWDGEWYLRAYDDEGGKLGSRDNTQCRIDLISQAWAVLAGMDAARAAQAMDSARKHLADHENRLIKLLTPPFTGEDYDPGYIAAYPPGVRENGGQYTHAACWYLMAAAMLGKADRVREALEFVRPDGRDRKYRAEPYVLAADIYGEKPYAGRGGWTWYTGSAGWFLTALRYISGFEKHGNKVRMNALRGVWERPVIRMRYGRSEYTLVSESGAQCVTLDRIAVNDDYITLTDDGCKHTAIFPQRK